MRVNGTDIIAVNGFDSGFFLVIRCAVNEQAAVFVQQLFVFMFFQIFFQGSLINFRILFRKMLFYGFPRANGIGMAWKRRLLCVPSRIILLLLQFNRHTSLHNIVNDGLREKARCQPLMIHGSHCGFNINGSPFFNERNIGKHQHAIHCREQHRRNKPSRHQLRQPPLFASAALGCPPRSALGLFGILDAFFLNNLPSGLSCIIFDAQRCISSSMLQNSFYYTTSFLLLLWINL